MRSRVNVTVGCPSVRPSVRHRLTAATVAAGGFAAEQEISIDSCGRWHSAANAGSVMLTEE